MGCGSLPAGWGFTHVQDDGTTTHQEWYQFSSEHHGLVNFALADGSVRGISENINQVLFLRLSAMRDGNVVGEF